MRAEWNVETCQIDVAGDEHPRRGGKRDEAEDEGRGGNYPAHARQSTSRLFIYCPRTILGGGAGRVDRRRSAYVSVIFQVVMGRSGGGSRS